MSITSQIDVLLEATRFKKEKGEDPQRGLSKMAEWKDQPDIGLHFSDLNKVGLKPGSHYNTPMGIYTYIFDKKWFDVVRQDKVPFAGDRKFLHLVQIKKSNRRNFVVVRKNGNANYGARQYKKDLAKLKKEYENTPKAGWDAFVAHEEFQTTHDTPFGKLWNITRRLGALSGGSISKWTSILMSLGIDGVIDYGAGIIHKNEPRQMVIFNPKSYKRVLTVTQDELSRSRTSGISDDPKMQELEARIKSWFGTAVAKAGWVDSWELKYMSYGDINKSIKAYKDIAKEWELILKDVDRLADIKGMGDWGNMTSEAGKWSPKKHIERTVTTLQRRFRTKVPAGLTGESVDDIKRNINNVIESLYGIEEWEKGFDKALAKKDVKKAVEFAQTAPRRGNAYWSADRRMMKVKEGVQNMVHDILWDDMMTKSPSEVTDEIKEIMAAVKSWGWQEVTSNVTRTINDFMDSYEKRAA